MLSEILWAVGKGVGITAVGSGLIFLVSKFYQSMKPSRGEEWHKNVELHIQEANALIERFIQVETRLSNLAKQVDTNERLDSEDRQRVFNSITHLHEKLDRLMERLLDQVSGRA